MHHLYHGYASHDHSGIIFRNVINKYWHLFRDIVTWSATLAYSKGTSQARMACTNPPTRYVHRLCKVFLIGWHNYTFVFVTRLIERTCIIYPESFSSCLLYTSPSPRDGLLSRMPSSA